MADENVVDVPSLLDEDLSQVDPSLPLLREQDYDLELVKIEQAPTNDQQGEVLKLSLRTVDDTVGTKNEVVHKFFPLTHTILITEKGGMTKEMIKRALAEVTQAFGLRTVRDLLSSGGQGKIVTARVKIQPAREDKKTGESYPERNIIKGFRILRKS